MLWVSKSMWPANSGLDGALCDQLRVDWMKPTSERTIHFTKISEVNILTHTYGEGGMDGGREGGREG